MSKSSGTNSPRASDVKDCFFSLYTIYAAQSSEKRRINGGNSDGDPPLPIPNREVKPVSADGTAIPSGRVGSRQPSEDNQKWLSSFFLLSAECFN